MGEKRKVSDIGNVTYVKTSFWQAFDLDQIYAVQQSTRQPLLVLSFSRDRPESGGFKCAERTERRGVAAPDALLPFDKVSN